MKNFSRKSAIACSKELSPELKPNDQSTQGLSGRESRAKRRNVPSARPCAERSGTTCADHERWSAKPATEKPHPKITEHQAPTLLPKRVYRPKTMIVPPPPSHTAAVICQNITM